MRAIVRRASIRNRAVISIAVSFFVPVGKSNSRAVQHLGLWRALK